MDGSTDLELGVIRQINDSGSERHFAEKNPAVQQEVRYRRNHRDAYARELFADAEHPQVR